MDIYTALAYVVLGALLGAIGQCARVIVGIKKHLDEAFKTYISKFYPLHSDFFQLILAV